ncbi:hypothetical protein ACF0H5_013550 [Mactra antiquata]
MHNKASMFIIGGSLKKIRQEMREELSTQGRRTYCLYRYIKGEVIQSQMKKVELSPLYAQLGINVYHRREFEENSPRNEGGVVHTRTVLTYCLYRYIKGEVIQSQIKKFELSPLYAQLGINVYHRREFEENSPRNEGGVVQIYKRGSNSKSNEKI